MVDPNVRKTSAFSHAGRPGLTKEYSVSTPNVASLDEDNSILEKIRDLELQISNQQARQSSSKVKVAKYCNLRTPSPPSRGK